MSRSTRVDLAVNVGAVITLAVAVGVVSLGIIHLADEPLAPCTPTSTSVCSGPPTDHSPNGEEYDSLPPCPTEDSVGCRWDASEQGNGQGHDVVTQP